MLQLTTRVLKDFYRNIYKFIIDVALIVIAFYAAKCLMAQDIISIKDIFSQGSFFLYVFLSVGGLLVYRTYQSYWRYTSLRDLLFLLKMVFFVNSAYYCIEKFLYYFQFIHINPSFARIVFLFFAQLSLFAGVRIFYRLYRSYNPLATEAEVERILIIGVTSLSDIFLRHIHHHLTNFNILGFIDTRAKEIGHRFFHGYRILGNIHHIETLLPTLLDKGKIHKIYVTDSQLDKNRINQLFTFCQTHHIELLRVNDVETKNAKDFSKLSIRAINLEDLLSRPPRQPDIHLMKSLITNRTIFITGAGGSIGSEIVRQVLRLKPKSVHILDHNEFHLYKIEQELLSQKIDCPHHSYLGSITDKERMEEIFQGVQPDIVFHAAAIKHVPIAENNPSEAIKTNIIGTKYIADLCIQYAVKAMILISTDKAVNPTSIMGATKRAAEIYCQWLNHSQTKTFFTAVRFGNVLGSAGSVIPLFQEQIKKGGPLTITHPEMVRFFMTIKEAVQLVIQAGAVNMKEESPSSIYILDMGNPVKIIDIAYKLIELNGLEPDIDIKIVFTGVRPGEKLYEELSYNMESLVRTQIKGVNVSHENTKFDTKAFNDDFEQISQVIYESNDNVMKALEQFITKYH